MATPPNLELMWMRGPAQYYLKIIQVSAMLTLI